jgi:protein-S-isoprenylcysteine O-methyltransferase Ste14
MKKRIKIQGFLVFLILTFTILLSKFLFPHWKEETLDEFLDALGIGIVLFGFLFRIAARGHKAEISPDGRHLITDGLYALMRNPMYFGTLLIGIGVILVLFKWWVLPLFLVIFSAIYFPQINREEHRLSRYFGQEYQNYCRIVPKYFPPIVSLFKTDFRDYLFFEWQWVKKDLPSLILVTGLIIGIEIWEDIRVFGHEELIKELLELCLIIILFMASFIFFKKKNV